MEFFGRQKRKSCLQIEPHLVPEYRPCTGAGTVTAINPRFQNPFKKIKILLHQKPHGDWSFIGTAVPGQSSLANLPRLSRDRQVDIRPDPLASG